MEERTVDLTIPEHVWEDASEDATSGSRLHAALHINGVLFFAEAIELTRINGEQVAADPRWEDTLCEARIAAGSEGPWYPLTIKGREYGVFISPSCD